MLDDCSIDPFLAVAIGSRDRRDRRRRSRCDINLGNYRGRDGVALAFGTKPVVGLPLHVHAVNREGEALSYIRAHLPCDRHDPRGCAENRAVEVHDCGVVALNYGTEACEELDAPGVLVRRIVFREVVAEASDAKRSREGIDDRVSYNVPVRMGVESLREVRESDAAEHGQVPVVETVDVVSPSDPEHERSADNLS